MEVTTDDVHDSEALPALINEAYKHGKISGAVMDGAYDNSKAYNLLRGMGVKPVIKPRRNARDDRGPPERRRAVRLIKKVGDEGWTRIIGYGRRWMVETAFSTFKRTFGDYCMAKELTNIAKELTIKAYIYNTIINL